MEGQEEKTGRERDEIFSKAVRAGKRTYFFDVKATRRNDYYLTITESKKRFNRDGRYYFEKHKLFLYKEDFEKFAEGLEEVVEYIKKNQPEILPREDFEDDQNVEMSATVEDENMESTDAPVAEEKTEDDTIKEFTNVEFEDLDE